MNTSDAISRLQERIALVRKTTDRHRQMIATLEGEAQRLQIALGVMEQLEASSGDSASIGSVASESMDPMEATSTVNWLDISKIEPMNTSLKVPFVYGLRPPPLNNDLMPPTTKHLIKALFDGDDSFTRLDVLNEVKARKPDTNEGTVATTLSKLVSEGYLLREGNHYKRKADIASAGNTSDVDDLL